MQSLNCITSMIHLSESQSDTLCLLSFTAIFQVPALKPLTNNTP